MKNRTRVRICRFQPAGVLQIFGEDALSFIQGQFTQEVKGAEAGSVRYGLWLNQKGKVLADSFILRTSDGGFQVISYGSPASVIQERLEAYIIADDVEIVDQTGAWSGLTILGEGAEDWLQGHVGQVPLAGNFVEADGGLIWSGRRGETVSWDWLMPLEKAASVEVLPEYSVSQEELERLRIESGIPAVPCDVGPGDLPNEAGLERDAISYTKGCYLGQEVMARLKAMGQVRRRLVRVRGIGESPEVLPASLFFGDKRVGEIRSAVRTESGWVGLAMVMMTGLTMDAALSFSSAGVGNVRMESLRYD
jgi:tRNA-modifying protein YgfZ